MGRAAQRTGRREEGPRLTPGRALQDGPTAWDTENTAGPGTPGAPTQRRAAAPRRPQTAHARLPLPPRQDGKATAGPAPGLPTANRP